MIRYATIDDLIEVVNLTEYFYNKYLQGALIPFNKLSFYSWCKISLKDPTFCIIIYERDDTIIGCLIGKVVESHINSDIKLATELGYAFKPGHKDVCKSLLVAFEVWAKCQRANHTIMNSLELHNLNKIGSLLESVGYNKIQNTFSKDI